jgi:hypothetical protein
MPNDWTPERRAEQSAKMKKSHEARRAATPEPAAVAETLTPVVNPPVNEDIVRDSEPAPRRTPRRSDNAVPQSLISSKSIDTADIISILQSLPLDSMSYADCGTLINALNAATTALALARRQKQEQLEAGTHRAPCATCGRAIDITKSGGFQILTERDEHWQPRNVYYCSQSCLLSKNMPSRTKQKEVSKI